LAWTARPDGHIYWYNKRWHDYTGTTPEETGTTGVDSSTGDIEGTTAIPDPVCGDAV